VQGRLLCSKHSEKSGRDRAGEPSLEPRLRGGLGGGGGGRRTCRLVRGGRLVRDRKFPPDTRLAGSSPCLITGVHRDQHLAIDSRGTPAPCGTVVPVAGPAFESLPRRKPRGYRGAVWSGAIYGDFRIADDSHVSPRGPAARSCRRERRRRACSIASIRGPGGSAALGEGLRTL